MQVTKVFTQRYVGCKKHVSGEFVKFTGKFPGMEINDVVAFLEFVQFLKYDDGNDYIVLFKFVNTSVIVQKYVRVNDKKFFVVFLLHDK